MSDQGIKSRPVYAPISKDPLGRSDLLIMESRSGAASAFMEGTKPDDFGERWSIAGHSQAIPSPHDRDRDHEFRSTQHLLIALRSRLARERMGFRLYVVGTEPFIWKARNVAEEFGLGSTEVRLFAVGSAARRVFCNHCRTITEGVTTDIVICSGCEANLLVRDHFSRHMNAYAGVQVDAETPGDVPPAKVLYP